jgi:hypothetical protein
MDYEALKEQWSEVEDRDGVRLSWNVFPSTRMASIIFGFWICLATNHYTGSIEACGSNWCTVHAAEGEG